MNQLHHYLDNVKKHNEYTLLALLKEGPQGKTEKVLSPQGVTCIRKSFPLTQHHLVNEYRLLERLDHPALPKVYEYYELADEGVFIEEYIEGISLAQLIATAGPFTEPKAVEIIKKLCRVVLFLHQQTPNPVIHRDIKPDNILLLNGGAEIKLIDFGTAREYDHQSHRDTVYMGTIGYAPPEQYGYGQTDARADVHGIGMTLYHMLTAAHPQRGIPPIPSTSSISQDIQDIILKATRFDPAMRYPGVAPLLEALNSLVPDVKGFLGVKQRLLENPTDFYPKYLPWPLWAKILLLPLHGVFFVFLFVINLNNLFTTAGFGFKDDLIRFFSDFSIFSLILFPPYALGLNLFNLNIRLGFFKNNRGLKKILLILICFLIGGFLLAFLGSLHSEAYQLAKNSAGS